MAFNIKNEETIAVAREIAEQTGESIASVFDRAVRERAAKIRANDEERIARIKRYCREINSRIGPLNNDDLNELLYDPKTGLPR